MRKIICPIALLALVFLLPVPAAAQQRVPDTGMFSFGILGGAAIPSEPVFDPGPQLGVSFEGYLTPRVSIRGLFSGAWFDVDGGRPFEASVEPMLTTGNLVYNWERGKWHPFAAGGLGIYHYRFDENDIDSSDTELGLNFGGGIEYFFTRRDTLTAELTFHFPPSRVASQLSDYEARLWTITAGYKKYF